jgi:hypothetical protein
MSFRAMAGPSGRFDASALLERARKIVASIPCRDCGRPSNHVSGRYSASGAVVRDCLCGSCKIQAQARRARLLSQRAALGV